MKVSAAIILAAAIGASARPHAHQRAHNRREYVVANKPDYSNVDVSGVDFSKVDYSNPDPKYTGGTGASAGAGDYSAPAAASTKEAETAAPAATSAATYAAPSAAPKKSSGKKHNSGSSSGSSGYKAFCGGKKAKRATLEDIAATGNTGVEGDFGCNIMTVDSDVADKYDYVTTFKNAASVEKNCVCFNKIGPKGLIDGFWKNNQALTFTVPASGSQDVAFDEDSQGGCVCAGGDIPTTSIGQWAGTWLEFDFGSKRNKGWSGADASCLVSAANKEKIPGLRVCGHNTCSTINPGGTGKNAYLAGMEDEDGVGLNIAPGKARLTVDIDYSS
ncbi:hypothetical protein ACHAPJ_003169 [Fusarium lateritium]